MIIRQVLEQYMEDKDNLWTSESPITTLKMGSQSASIVTNTNIWQKNANQRRKNMKPESVSNITKKDILPRTVEKNS